MSSLDLMLNDSIPKQLDNFFSSLQGDNGSLSTFLTTLSIINDTVRMHRSKLHENTLLAIHNFASVITSVTQNMLDLEESVKNLQVESERDISKIIEDGMEDLTLNDPIAAPGAHDDSGHIHHVQLPAYIEPCFSWLLSHLHNPYPSKEVRANMARKANCRMRIIDDWFKGTRKKIGWNKLRLTCFSNKQEKIIAAARKHFHPTEGDLMDKPNHLLGPDFSAEFALMEETVKALYRSRHLNFSIIHPPKHSSEKPQPYPLDESVPQAIQPIYPTPTPSRDPSPSSHRAPDTLSSNVKSRKRTRSPFDLHTEEPSYSRKRPRCETSEVCHLPSPAASETESSSEESRYTSLANTGTGGIDITPIVSSSSTQSFAEVSASKKRKRSNAGDEGGRNAKLSRSEVAEPNPVDSTSLATLPLPKNRKRRLSNDDLRRPTRRPHIAMAIPRLQAVSNPLPLPHNHVHDSCDTPSGNEAIVHFDTHIPPLPHVVNFMSTNSVNLCVQPHQYDFSTCPSEEQLPEVSFLGTSSPSLPCLDSKVMTLPAPLDLLWDFGMANNYMANNYVTEHMAALDSSGRIESDLHLSGFRSSELMENEVAAWSLPPSSVSVPPIYGENPPACMPFSQGNCRPSITTHVDDHKAKRARVEALRAELWQLQVELGVNETC